MSKPGIHCFTSVSLNYLDRAQVLGETLREYHPEWTLWLLLSDSEPPDYPLDPGGLHFDHLVRLTGLDIPNVLSWAFGHDVIELCTAVKGVMLQRLLTKGDAVVYLDPDIALFAPLTDVIALIEHHSVILTPHVLDPEPDFEIPPHNEIGSLKFGAYNLGFLAVRNCPEGRRFATWWRNRLLRYCFDDLPGGLFVDQKWCDLAPTLFSDVHILRDPGYNVASWNLGQRLIEIAPNGELLAAEHALRFFHFTKLGSIGESALERFAYGRTEVFELVRWYRERLEDHASGKPPAGWWAYGRYADGTRIPKAHRVVWRERSDLRETFTDPFASGPGSFQEWGFREIPGRSRIG